MDDFLAGLDTLQSEGCGGGEKKDITYFTAVLYIEA